MTTLELDDLMAVRGKFTLGPVSVSLDRGEILGLCGANGSGKTTLINVILGTLLPAAGSMTIFGQSADLDGRSYMRRVGFVPDESTTLFDELTASEHVRLTIARRDGAARSDQVRRRSEVLLEALELHPDRMLARSFSHGMKKKLQIVLALMHEPDLLIVDELRNGLDPLSARTAESLIVEAAGRGTTIIVATHDLFWVERLNLRVLLLRAGEVCAAGSASELVRDGGSLEDSFVRMYS